MSTHIACAPLSRYVDADPGGCRVVCTEHALNEFHGTSHADAVSAMRLHRAAAHTA